MDLFPPVNFGNQSECSKNQIQWQLSKKPGRPCICNIRSSLFNPTLNFLTQADLQCLFRVVRGQHGWDNRDEDGGEGGVGTVMIADKLQRMVIHGETKNMEYYDTLVYVKWDSGEHRLYKFSSKEDKQLRVRCRLLITF